MPHFPALEQSWEALSSLTDAGGDYFRGAPRRLSNESI